METFRQEIIETQKARSDLLKWKLIISASLGAVGLGINISLDSNGSNADSPIDLAFCLIPFVCAYVDLLCYHLNLRMFVINKFFARLEVNKPKKNNEEWQSWRDIYLFQEYEKTCGEVRDAFHLESLALKWSTIILSLIVIGVSYYAHDRTDAFWLVLTGTFGVLTSCISQIVYNDKAKNLQEKVLPSISFINELSLSSQKNYLNYFLLLSKQKKKLKKSKPNLSYYLLCLCGLIILLISLGLFILFV
ncbi:MAG: hypothetical protein WBM44_29005, partial [Waterburya sp.]